MATNDKGAGPILGQQVLYQVTGTHAIVMGTINANGSVNICQNPAPGSTTLIDRASVGFGGSLDGATATFDNKWAYKPRCRIVGRTGCVLSVLCLENPNMVTHGLRLARA
jgi:hypothetical protein